MSTPSLQRFLGELGGRLERVSADDLRTTLLAHAANLPSSQRQPFLDVFASASPAALPGELDLTWPIEGDPLLEDIEAFAEDVRSGRFSDGYGNMTSRGRHTSRSRLCACRAA